MAKLPNGTAAELRYMEPTMDGGSYGPFWEGSFEKQEYVYTLTLSLSDSAGDVATRALSTMVKLSRGVVLLDSVYPPSRPQNRSLRLSHSSSRRRPRGRRRRGGGRQEIRPPVRYQRPGWPDRGVYIGRFEGRNIRLAPPARR
jgi:hypothetical protein